MKANDVTLPAHPALRLVIASRRGLGMAACGVVLGVGLGCSSEGEPSTAAANQTPGGATSGAGTGAAGMGGGSASGGAPVGTAGTAGLGGAGNGSMGGAPTLGGAGSGGGATAGQAGSGGQPSLGGTGGLGGAGGASGGAGSSYQPCPTDGSPCLILPFGDSITDGVGSSHGAGYRPPLFELFVTSSQKATFVGSRSGGPSQVAGQPFPKQHEGRPGWTIDSGYVSFGEGISTLVPKPAFDTIPHIVLLMIGTNDVSASKGTDMIATRLDALLEKMVQVAPNALIVVAQITPIGWKPAAASTYNSKIPGIVQARVDKGQHLVVVDMSKMPTSGLDDDDLHPNDSGYAFMAGVWHAAIEDYLPR